MFAEFFRLVGGWLTGLTVGVRGDGWVGTCGVFVLISITSLSCLDLLYVLLDFLKPSSWANPTLA